MMEDTEGCTGEGRPSGTLGSDMAVSSLCSVCLWHPGMGPGGDGNLEAPVGTDKKPQ